MCKIAECYLIEMGYWIDKSKNIFKRNTVIPYKLSNYIVNQRNAVGVFNTAYRYDKENANESYLFGDMYFDFDSKDNFDAVREDAISTLKFLKTVYNIEPNEIQIYFSGNKGIHITVPNEIFGIEPLKNLNQIYKSIAKNIRVYSKNKTLDLVIYDNKRLFRIPRTIHESTGLYKIPINYEELLSASHNDIKSLAKNKRIIKFKKPKLNENAKNMYLKDKEKFEHEIANKPKYKVNKEHKLNYTPPCIKSIMDDGATNGNRNIKAAVLASFYKNSGIELEDTEGLINIWNDEKNSPPLNNVELNKTISSIYYGTASYGCSTLECISECNAKKCKFKNKLNGLFEM